MNSPRPVPIFDGHNDALLRLWKRKGPDAPRAFLDGEGKGQLDLPMARQGGFAGGMFAIFVPSPRKQTRAQTKRRSARSRHRRGRALAAAARSHDRTSRRVEHGVHPVPHRTRGGRTGAHLPHRARTSVIASSTGVLAAVLHIEGAEAIDPEFETLDVLHQAGLRSLGPVWSRPNAFGHGVPFRCPSSPDTGPGLTDLGKELVRACNRLKILIDLSHLNERGFWDVAELSDAPLVATHSNAHALSPHSRNLTDEQLKAIRETDGMVGVNFAVSFLREDGRQDSDTPVELIVDHIEHMIKQAGEDHVGLGSDFDGAMIPKGLGNAAGLPALVEAMRARGYGEPLIEKLCYRNWLRVLERTWK